MTKKENSKKKVGKKFEDSDEVDFVRIPPDGGYAWVVLVACFLINMIVDGFLYAFGAISNDLKKHFNCSEWAVSLVISLACSCYLVSAPLASALCNRFGCQLVGFIGGLIASFSVALSILAPNIETMWLLFGFVGGVGLGLVYLPSLVMIGYYFDKRRAIATGIVTAGTGIGSIVFGPISRFLFDFFGWRTGLLVLAAILSASGFCCLMMKPVTPIRKQSEQELKERLNPSNNETENQNKVHDYVNVKNSTSNTLQLPDDTRQRSGSTVSTRSRRSVKAEDAIRPMYQSDILYPGNVQNLPEFKAQPDLETYVQETTEVPEGDATNSMKSFWDAFKKMTNINLLADPKLVVLCLANICSMIGFYSPYLFIIKTATDERKVPERTAVYLLSFIGISNTVARFVSGWITKIPFITPLVTNIIGLNLAGIVTLFVPFYKTYFMLAVYCIIWGGSIAFHISMTPVAVCQLVGLKNFSSALSLIFLFRGIACLIAPPVMGAIQDYTKSFDVPFVISGIAFIVSGLLHIITLLFARAEAKNNTRAAPQV